MGFLFAIYIFGWLAALGGSAEGWLIVIVGTFILMAKSDTEHKVNHYDMSKVSTGKMAMDAGKSPSEIKRNLVAGKYDKDSEWRI